MGRLTFLPEGRCVGLGFLSSKPNGLSKIDGVVVSGDCESCSKTPEIVTSAVLPSEKREAEIKCLLID